MQSMFCYPKAAVERAMKVQEVILRAMAKKITWWQAAEIIGISDRQMRRWRERYEEFGYDGLFDRRQGKPSPKRVPVALVEQVLGLYRERRRTGFCGNITWQSSIATFRCVRQNGERPFCPSEVRTWTSFSVCSLSVR